MSGRGMRRAGGVGGLLLTAVVAGSAGTGSAGRPAHRPASGYLEYTLVVHQPSGVANSPGSRRPAGRRSPELQLQRSRHRIWFQGRRVRVEMTSQPPGVPLARAASVAVDYIRTEGKAGTTLVPDGYTLIHNGRETFLLSRSSRVAVELTSHRQPFLNSRHGALPSLPVIDRALLARWKPGKIGTESVGGYRADLYQLDDAASGPGARRDLLRVWVSDRLPVPVKFLRKHGDVEREEVLKTARFGIGVSERMFRLPAGTKIQEVEREEEEGPSR